MLYVTNHKTKPLGLSKLPIRKQYLLWANINPHRVPNLIVMPQIVKPSTSATAKV